MREIDDLVARFYRAFDNRDGRSRANEARLFFAEGAIVMRTTAADQPGVLTVDDFIAPRQALLASGTLTGFHEWEVEGRTFLFRSLAVRVSRYAKRGATSEGRYVGAGWKVFLLQRRGVDWQILALAWEDADATCPIETRIWVDHLFASPAERQIIAYEGSCHCGQVRFGFKSDVASPFVCNCSFCVRRGATLQKVPASAFELRSDPSELGVYGNRSFSKHHFCRSCGIHAFTQISRTDEASVAVNLHCVPAVDLRSLAPIIFDGANRL